MRMNSILKKAKEIFEAKWLSAKETGKAVAKNFIVGTDEILNEEKDYHYEKNDATRTKEDEWNDFIKYGKYPFLIGCFYYFWLFNLGVAIAIYIYSIMNLDTRFIIKHIMIVIIINILPIMVWIWSTMYVQWNFWRRKLSFLRIIVMGILVSTAQQLVLILYRPLLVGLAKLPINDSINEKMVVNLGRFVLLSLSLLPCAAIGIKIFELINDKDNKENILYFKLNRGLDFRSNKKFKYDFKVIRDMESGKQYTVKEKDRTLHTFADGTTGTAKTSSVLTPAIADDMDQKVYNEDYQKKVCLEEIKKGNFRIATPFLDDDFSINYISPIMKEGAANKLINDSRKRKYEFLKYGVQSAGITVVAPNAAFADEVYEMARNRKLKINRVDPILSEEGTQKPGFIGFNPFYISPLLKGVERDIDITNKANIFADILQALYEMSGAGDAYFISLNNSVTIATCKLLMLTYPDLHGGMQPDAGDVQNCINDFSTMKPYLDKLVQKYGRRDDLDPNDKVGSAIKSQRIDCGIWQDVYSLINNDLLGPNQDNMTDRANGLRLQINNFINHPLIRRVFCAKNTLDMDKALENGEIIIVNYALELGKSVSMAFGLFFLLSYSKACLRRPGTENTRILNINYIDELPVLLHPELEQFFTLFRQYKVANIVALQTLDQMDKSPMTKYLKGILLGNCAHQIIFGRVSPTEMQTYEKMAGKATDMMKQDTVSQTSITSENPSYSYSSRETKQLANRMEGSDFRYRDFQEVTFFTVDEGSPVPPFVGRVNFLAPARRKGMPRMVVLWNQYWSDELRGQTQLNVYGMEMDVLGEDFMYKRMVQIRSDTGIPLQAVKFTAKGLHLEPVHHEEKYIIETDYKSILSWEEKQPGIEKNKNTLINRTGGILVSEDADIPEEMVEQPPAAIVEDITLEDLLLMANTTRERGDRDS